MEKEKENKKRFVELFLQKGYKKLNSVGCYQYSLIPAKSNLLICQPFLVQRIKQVL